MNTIGIVLASVLGGMVGFAALIGLGILIWLALDLRKTLKDAQAAMMAAVDGTRSAIAQARQETKAANEAHRQELARILEEHRRSMQGGIDKINAEALVAAAARSVQASIRMEKVAGILQSMLLDAEAKSTHEYAPEEFAPEQSPFGGPPSAFNLSTTARLDEEAERAAVEQAPFEPESV